MMNNVYTRVTTAIAFLALLSSGAVVAEQAPASTATSPKPQASVEPSVPPKDPKAQPAQPPAVPKLSAEAQAKELDRLRKEFDRVKQQYSAPERPVQGCGSKEFVKLLDDLWALRTTQKAQGTTDSAEAKDARKLSYELREAIVKARDKELGVIGHRMVAGKGHMTRENVLADDDK